MNDSRQKLYNALSQKYDLGTFEEFNQKIDNEDSRKKLYDAVQNDFDLGSYEEYSGKLGFGSTPAPADPLGTTTIQAAPMEEVKQPRRGFKAGIQEGWKGLSAGAQFAFGEAANMITGSSQDDANALYELDTMLKEGKDIDAELDKAWTGAGIELRTGALEFLPGWAIKGLKERVHDKAENSRILNNIREAIGEANGDVAKAREILATRAQEQSFGDIQMEKAREKFGTIEETEGFGAWVGENTIQMIPSASALIVGALAKSPAAARAIGMIGMGGMTAATAGSSMYEAREAGASDYETHKVGVVDGAIEFITEKLPFDNYTNWMVGKAKGKVTRELAKSLQGNSAMRGELENLLEAANKKLGGKLFSKKNLSAYMADMLAEGASEFTAEASQTMTRLLYEDAEMFPLLSEAVGNGMQGALAGFFMGAVLGGASKTMEHHQNKQRRKDQGYVDVAVVNFGTAEKPEYDVVEILDVSDDTNLATVLQDGAVVEVNKNAIGQGYRYSYEEFEAGRMKVLESEAIDNGAVTNGMLKAADEREVAAESALAEALRNEGFNDEDIITIIEKAATDKQEIFVSDELAGAYEDYREAVKRSRQLRVASANQEQTERGLKRLEIEEKAGEFWRDNQTEDANGNPVFNPTVETGLLQDGTRVYILSDVNEAGEYAAVTENGEKKVVNADMLQDVTQILPLDDYLQSLVDAEKSTKEQKRMAEQTQQRVSDTKAQAMPGTSINFGTAEDPRMGTIVQNTPDGAMVQMEDGSVRRVTWDELANTLNIGSQVLTDEEIAGVEAADILGAESAFKGQIAASTTEIGEAAEETTIAAETMEQASPLPTKADGTVDQNALWNQDPQRWAEWNDEQKQDGGANSLAYINGAIERESARIAELQAQYGMESDFDTRDAIDKEVSAIRERLEQLIALQQKYTTPIEETTEVAPETIIEAAPEAVVETPVIEETDPVKQTLRDLYNDPELSESEIEDYINANVQESQKNLDKHLGKAPKMGTDMAKYKAEKAKHQEKTAELEKQRDFWREVQSYIEVSTSEMDMEPQNALEFTAKELTRKDGVKLQRDSFARHTGYGSEAGNFLSMLRTKQNGGLTLEEAGERLMEMDRENGTGFFDQSDPNAGLNAILEVIGGARTSGDVSGYIKANREQMAREEVAAARNAMIEEMAQPEVEIVDNLEEDLPEDIFYSISETTGSGTTEDVKAWADAWSKRLGIAVTVLDKVNEVTDDAARNAIAGGAKVAGWFNAEDGKVYIYAPNASSAEEVSKTFIHEVVSHKGLRGLLGKKGFNDLCDMIWDAMSPEAKAKYLTYEGVLTKARLAEYNANPEAFEATEKEKRAAADEFIARRSESINADKNAWQKMIDSVKRFINKMTGKYSIDQYLDDLLESSLARYETIAKKDLKGVVEDGQTYGGIIDTETGAKIDPSSDIQAEGNVSFRAKDGSLVGMHNISEDKLRKAIKQGGLANPSTAVVNIAEYSLEGYGDISLIMPSSLVDSETGDNAGTYTGDAWTPTYPTISRQVDDAGWKIIKDRIRAAVGESDALYHDIVNSVDNYLSDNRNSRLEFVFLKEKGIEPKIEMKGADGYVGLRNLEAILGVEGLRDSMESYEKYKAASPMAKRSFNMWQRVDGDKKAHKALKDEIRQYPQFAKLMGLDEDLTFAGFDSFTYSIFRKEYDAGNVNTIDTLGGASRYVDANDMRTEFEMWLESLMEEAGAKEVFFAGWTRDGDRIYKDNTLENVSRHMRMQGRTNAYNDHGLSATKSALLQRLTSLAEIRKNRARLKDESSYNKSYDELKDRLFSIISQLADMEKISDNPFMNIDYAEARLQEAIVKRNPISYLNNEYGYSIDPKGEYAEELKSFIKDVQKMPAKYFETKFERPVYLNEFAAAVMPNNTSEDVKQALTEAGLPIFEYDSAVEGARREATLKATEEEGVRFRILGEMGAANLDAAEEATTRLDNLEIARQMEEAGKDSKTIRLATGWERGVDNLWRYEVPDEYDLANLEKRLQEELDNGAAKTWGIVYPSDLGQLLKEYPDFNVDIMVWVGDEFENTGAYSPATEGDENTFGRSASIEVEAKTIADVAPLLAHEIQHAIQEMEGFAEGGQARGLNDKLSAELDKRVATIKQLRAEGRNEEADELMQMSKGLAEAVINNEDDPYGNYKKLAGEVEARNAAKRIGKSLQERRESLLSETEDVALEDQIILIDGLNARSQFIPSLLNLRKAVNKIKSWMSNDTRNDSFEIALPNSVLRKIRSVMGRDFDSHNITANGLAHALKNHGVNGKKLSDTSIPIRKEDMELVPYIMTAPDRIEKGSTKNNRESVRFIKNISNGYIVVIEKELDNSMDDLETINMWAELSDVSNATRALNRTSETSTIGRSDIAKIRKDAEDAILSEELKQKISQVSTAHNSLLNATPSALSADKGGNNLGESNTRFRITPKMDAEYMEAVEAGDMETAQRMVDKAADAAGYNMAGYHGTPNEFNTFEHRRAANGKMWGDGFYFAESEREAKQWGDRARRYGQKTRVISAYLSVHNPVEVMSENGSYVTGLDSYVVEQILNQLDPEYDADIIEAFDTGYLEDFNGEKGERIGDIIKDLGYDAVIGSYYGDSHIMVFNPSQIKSAEPVTYDDDGNVIPLSERFNPENEDIRFRVANENQAIFVSNAAKAVEGIKQEKATPEQWLKMIEKNGGLKAGEDKWMGLSDWLKASDKKTLTKAEVLDFINENMIVIEEQHYSEDENALDGKRQEIQEALQGFFDEYVAESEDMNDDMFMKTHYDYAIQKLADELGYTAFNAPFINNNALVELDFYEDDLDTLHELNNKLGLEKYDGTRDINDTRLSYTTEGLTDKHEIALVVPTIESWNESDDIHFGDAGEGRAVAWIRFGDTKKLLGTVEVEGKKKFNWAKVLVIDEIQSKRHQERRDIEEKVKKFEKVRDEKKALLDEYATLIDNKVASDQLPTEEERAEFDKRKYEWEKAVNNYNKTKERSDAVIENMDAPFDKNWHELAMKRMLRYAAENDYDYIAWTKGDQQAERYKLSKVIEGIYKPEAKTEGTNLFEIRSYAPSAPRFITTNTEGKIIDALDNDGDEMQDYINKNLSEVFGKDLAQQMLGASEKTYISEEELVIGGEGMKGFYDKMLPAFMNKYGKKWGVKVEDINLPGLENGLAMHSVPVTEEMKASVMEGQVMFRVRGENESAVDFCLSVANEITSKYRIDARTRVAEVNEKNAKVLGYENGIIDDIAIYLPDYNMIVIFAHEELTNSLDIECAVFHEIIHKYADTAAGEWLWKYADGVEHLAGIKQAIIDKYPEEEYSNEDRYDEMLCESLAQAMTSGTVNGLWKILPEGHQNSIDKILNEIRYDRNTESTERVRRALEGSEGSESRNRGVSGPKQESNGLQSGDEKQTREDAARNNRVGSDAGTRLRIAELTSDEKRLINEYFPGAFPEEENEAQPDNTGEFSDEDGDIRYRIVTDPAKIEELEDGPKVEAYRAVQIDKNGRIYSPMASRLKSTKKGTKQATNEAAQMNQWDQAVESLDKVDENGRITILDEDGGTTKVAYNPYGHCCVNSMMNDQFKRAWERDGLYVMKVLAPESELTAGYHAEKAKDAVGIHKWKTGAVGNKLPENKRREILLTRWMKNVKVMPWEEVAQDWIKTLDGENVDVPFNVVPRKILNMLAEAGVKIVAPEKGMENAAKAYEQWLADPKGYVGNTELPDHVKALNEETDDEGPDNETRFRTTGTPTEAVVAEGLNLSPAQTAELAGNIFAALPEESRKKITDGLNGNILGLQDAILQIPTSLALKENWNDEDRAIAQIVSDEVTKMVGQDLTRPFSAPEALWMLYNALNKSTDLISAASRALVQSNLGFDAETLARLEEAKEGVRFRTVGDASVNAAASLYNRGSVNVWTRLKESFVDMNASVEELVKAIERRSGKIAEGFENILLALNQQNSKGRAAMEDYKNKYLKPMFKAIREIMDKTDFKYEDIVRHVILKHGLERNKKLAQRDARAHYQEIYDDIMTKINEMTAAQKRTYLTNAQLRDADAKAELATLQNVDTTTFTEEQKVEHKRDLAKARKAAKEAAEYLKNAKKIATLSEQEAIDELDKIFEKIENETDSVYKELRKNDYSGISSMFYEQLGVDRKNYSTEEQYQSALMAAKADKYSTLADVEEAAAAEVSAFESMVDTKNLWKRINAATKETLRQQYEANMISKDQYESLRNMFEYYVPLRGFKDNTAEDMYTYYRKPNSTGYTKPILGAEGRKTEAESPFGWIASMAGSAIASNVKNEAKLALYYFVSNRPENGIATLSRTWFVDSGEVDANGKKIFKPAYPPFSESLSSDQAKAAYEAWQENMRELQKKGQAYESGQRLNLGNAVVNISEANRPEHIVNVKVAGKDYTIVINGNPRAAQAINGDLNIEKVAQDYGIVFGPILRWMSSVNTSYNPEFWITNFMRDFALTAMAVTTKEDPAYQRKFFKNYAKAFKVIKMVRQNEKDTIGDSYLENMYKDFVKYGSVTGYTQIKGNEEWEKEIAKYLKSNDPGDVRNGKIMRGTKEFFHVMHQFGESLEQVSRFAAFLTSREMGKDIYEAVNDAKEITVNFNRKGSGKMITLEEAKTLTDSNGQPLNQFEQWMAVGLSSIAPLGRRFIMFFNAAIQGLNATYKLWDKDPKRFAGWALAYFAVGLMNAVLHAMMDDDDDYLDIPAYERRNSLMLGGNGAYFKWALPQEARAFYALGDLAVETAMGRVPQKFYEKGGELGQALSIATEVLPVNPSEGWKAFMPSIAIPFIELALNEDYKGSPIYNEQKWLTEEEREKSAKWSKAYQNTGKLYTGTAKMLNAATGGDKHEAGLINLQPEKMEHLVQSAFGGTIRTADKFINTFTAIVDPEEEWSVRQTPFLNRVLTINDERFRNVYVNEVFDYYKADAEHALSLEKKYIKDRDAKSLDDLRRSDEYQWAKIYGKYKKPLKSIQEKLKVADGTAERKELMKQQDELKKQMIKEISEL